MRKRAWWREAIGIAVLVGALAATVDAAPTRDPNGIRFTYNDPNAGAVFWAGAFNAWSASANPLTKDAGGTWSVVIALPAGEHEYKFVVDGQWVADPENGVTRGDFGNSLVSVGANGELVAAQATSNTPYSPKIFMGGRVIGLYQLIHNDANRRFELRRPETDVDLKLDVRISDLVQARVLMNINGRAQGTDFFRTSLNYDRGALQFTQPKFQILAYDNESSGTWDDPLHLVGDIGIYHHAYGYGHQGFKVTSQHWGFASEAQYSDNFEPGGTSYLILPPETPGLLLSNFNTTFRNGRYEVDPGAFSATRLFNVSDGNENTFAFRSRRELGTLTLGVLGRNDRGFNLGSIDFIEAVGPTQLRRLFGTAEQQWLAGGAEVRWRGPRRLELFGEFLRGATRVNPVDAFNQGLEVTQADTSGVLVATETSLDPASGDHRALDRSNRYRVGGLWTEAHGDVRLQLDVERQTHEYAIFFEGMENSMTIWRMAWDRNWRYYLGREIKTRLDVEYTDFHYQPYTPWSYQLWFPFGNFWLEHGEHLVSVDRLVMLGGDDVISVRPGIEVPLLRSRNATFRWDGTFNGVSLDRVPKYAESIFRLGVDLTRSVRFSTDTRWVKYDDPVLRLDNGYVSNFFELNQRFAPNINVALSFGVDPYAIDEPVNDWAYIGRDLFLFERGADGASAETDFFGLGARIAAAEKALRDERRIQVKGTVNF